MRRIVAEHTYTPYQRLYGPIYRHNYPDIDNINENVVIDHFTLSTDSDRIDRRVVELDVLAEGLKA